MFYEQLFFTKISKVQKDTHNLNVFLGFWDLHKKAAHKMLVKSTPGVRHQQGHLRQWVWAVQGTVHQQYYYHCPQRTLLETPSLRRDLVHILMFSFSQPAYKLITFLTWGVSILFTGRTKIPKNSKKILLFSKNRITYYNVLSFGRTSTIVIVPKQ